MLDYPTESSIFLFKDCDVTENRDFFSICPFCIFIFTKVPFGYSLYSLKRDRERKEISSIPKVIDSIKFYPIKFTTIEESHNRFFLPFFHSFIRCLSIFSQSTFFLEEMIGLTLNLQQRWGQMMKERRLISSGCP